MKLNNILLASLLAMSPLSLAKDNALVLNYDGFFDRMDDLDEPEYVDVKLAFYFKNKQNGEACKIDSAELKTQDRQKQVYFLASGELLLPFDEQLDMDKAKLIIHKQDNQECGLDMRLENSQLLSQDITTEQVSKLTKTFGLALKELGGMMSFLVPDVAGVTFLAKPGQALVVESSSKIQCNDNGCTIKAGDMTNDNQTIRFNYPPQKAVPFIE